MRFLWLLAAAAPLAADVTGHASDPANSLMVPDDGGGMLIYDAAKNKWDRVEGGHPHSRYAIGIAADRTMIVWGGGQERGEEFSMFDLKARSWVKIDRPPLEIREAFAASVQGNRLAIWGGTRGWGIYFSDGATYDFSKKKWEAIPHAPIEGRAWPGMAWVGNRLVVGGGYGVNQEGYSNGAVFNLATRSWTKVDPLFPGRRGAPVMAAVRGRVFLWGGRKDEALLFDPATGKSEELPPSPAPTRGFAGSAVLDSKIYMFGGYGDGQSHRKDALEFDLAKKRWRVLPEPPLSVRYNPTVVADRRRIYVWAGLGDGDAFPKDAAFYDPRTDRWERLADIPGSSLTARLYYR